MDPRDPVTVASGAVNGASAAVTAPARSARGRRRGQAGRAGRVRQALAGSVLTLAAPLLAAACGVTGHDSAPTTIPLPSAKSLLERSVRVLDATRSVHFQLLSTGLPPKTTALASGRGDLVRPADAAGSLLVSASGPNATIKVVAADGKFYVELPFNARYAVAKPETYGLGNPASLLSRTAGLSSLLAHLVDPTRHGSVRLDGELLDVATGTLPGAQVPFLTDRDRSQPVAVTADIATRSWQVRRLELSGPFVKPGTVTTYTIELTDYGEHVRISAPPT